MRFVYFLAALMPLLVTASTQAQAPPTGFNRFFYRPPMNTRINRQMVQQMATIRAAQNAELLRQQLLLNQQGLNQNPLLMSRLQRLQLSLNNLQGSQFNINNSTVVIGGRTFEKIWVPLGTSSNSLQSLQRSGSSSMITIGDRTFEKIFVPFPLGGSSSGQQTPLMSGSSDTITIGGRTFQKIWVPF
jgi:hypothetical protein